MSGQSPLTRQLVADGCAPPPARWVRPNTIKARILAALPATNRQLADLICTHGGDIARTMVGLVADGLVTSTAKGRGTIAVYSRTAAGDEAISGAAFSVRRLDTLEAQEAAVVELMAGMGWRIERVGADEFLVPTDEDHPEYATCLRRVERAKRRAA